jgi:hypothetical protein
VYKCTVHGAIDCTSWRGCTPTCSALPNYLLLATYQGCFRDGPASRPLLRQPTEGPTFAPRLDLRSCAARCDGHEYFGMRAGGVCRCGAADGTRGIDGGDLTLAVAVAVALALAVAVALALALAVAVALALALARHRRRRGGGE